LFKTSTGLEQFLYYSLINIPDSPTANSFFKSPDNRLNYVYQPLVSIITVNYNQPEMTVAMLDSIRNLAYPNLEIFVVDNGSKSNPIPALEAQFPEIIGIRSDENLGFAGGNNLAVPKARGELIFFVNNDTELADGLIEKLVACFDTIPKLGAVSPLIMYYPGPETDGKNIIQFLGATKVNSFTARNRTLAVGEENIGQYRNKIAYPSPYAHGAAMMVPARVIKEVGAMSNLFFLYYEELDWCDRIRAGGYQVYIEPKAEIFHKESVSTGKTSPLKTYYLNRNRIYFMRRNRTSLEIMAFYCFLLVFTIPKNLLMFAIKGQWDHFKAFTRAIKWNFTRADRKHQEDHQPVNTFFEHA